MRLVIPTTCTALSSLLLLSQSTVASAFVPSFRKHQHRLTSVGRQKLGVSVTPSDFLLQPPTYNNNNNNNNSPTATTSTDASAISTATKSLTPPLSSTNPNMPMFDPDSGLYHILNQSQHAALLEAASDKIIILKCFAPWCRACKGLEPKFAQFVTDPKYATSPIIWADLSIQHNKEFVKSLGILALPTIQFYVAGQLVDTFACGPSKVPTLKRKLATLVNDHVDKATMTVKQEFVTAAAVASATPISITKSIPGTAQRVLMTPEQRKLFEQIPYFSHDMSIADADDLLDNKAVLKTFAPGEVLLREGETGNWFFVLQSGEVEVCRATCNHYSYADPLVAAPPSYLGTVVNVLTKRGDYFGERALITGEGNAASIRALTKVKVWVLNRHDFPASSVLSGKTKGSADMVSTADEKYGVTLTDTEVFSTSWQEEVVKANQVRGSVNRPEVIMGVDTPDELSGSASGESFASDGNLPLKMQSVINKERSAAILNLLNRFQLIRHVSRCFDYIVHTQATWGDDGIRKRRSMLVSRLTPAQRAEFVEAFRLIDRSGNGMIELIELKRVMESIGEDKTDQELSEMIAKGSRRGQLDARSVISMEDFLGIMAEAEFYHLFRDIFAAFDKNDTGYIKAKEMCRVLEGVRDLISDDRSRTLIDVEDEEMLIDYEQFSRMLLGSTLA